jgi:trk system potassium uptake protein TrkH
MASAILMMYLILFLSGAVLISAFDELPLRECLFETASAIGTVGLTMGITTKLSSISKIIIIVLMFLGRVGGLTVIFAATRDNSTGGGRVPRGNITIG